MEFNVSLLLSRVYHWWVMQFLPAQIGPPTQDQLMHAADTAGYWAQAAGSLLAVVVALTLAGAQRRKERRELKWRRSTTRDAVQSICYQGQEELSRFVRGAHAALKSKDVNYVPSYSRMCDELYGSITGIAVNELADAQALEASIVAKKALKDWQQALAYIDIADATSMDRAVLQLAQVGDKLSTVENGLDEFHLMRRGVKKRLLYKVASNVRQRFAS